MPKKINLTQVIYTTALSLSLLFQNDVLLAQETSQKQSLDWYLDYESALAAPESKDKNVLLYFSGSDWCKPCIQLSKNILETPEFSQYASENLIPVKLDFPKMKKNKLSKHGLQHNEELAEKYNPNGVFPLLVFLDNDQEIIGFTGFSEVSPIAYVSMIKQILQK